MYLWQDTNGKNIRGVMAICFTSAHEVCFYDSRSKSFSTYKMTRMPQVYSFLNGNNFSKITYSKPLEHFVVVYFGIHLPLLSLKLVILHHFEYMLQSLVHRWHLLCHLNGLISVGHTLQFTLLSY